MNTKFKVILICLLSIILVSCGKEKAVNQSDSTEKSIKTITEVEENEIEENEIEGSEIEGSEVEEPILEEENEVEETIVTEESKETTLETNSERAENELIRNTDYRVDIVKIEKLPLVDMKNTIQVIFDEDVVLIHHDSSTAIYIRCYEEELTIREVLFKNEEADYIKLEDNLYQLTENRADYVYLSEDRSYKVELSLMEKDIEKAKAIIYRVVDNIVVDDELAIMDILNKFTIGGLKVKNDSDLLVSHISEDGLTFFIYGYIFFFSFTDDIPSTAIKREEKILGCDVYGGDKYIYLDLGYACFRGYLGEPEDFETLKNCIEKYLEKAN